MATRQSLAPGLTEFAAACLRGGNSQKTGKRFCILSGQFNLAQRLHSRVVNINDQMGLEK
jgi:hypothetical protein